jgi:hypothetical protein
MCTSNHSLRRLQGVAIDIEERDTGEVGSTLIAIDEVLALSNPVDKRCSLERNIGAAVVGVILWTGKGAF